MVLLDEVRSHLNDSFPQPKIIFSAVLPRSASVIADNL